MHSRESPTVNQKVLIITDVGSIGGSERRLLTLAQALRKAAVDVLFCTLSPAGELNEQLRREGHSVIALGVTRRRDYALAVMKLVYLVARWRPNVIHGQIVYSAFLAVAIGQLMRVPKVLATRTYTRRLGGWALIERITGLMAHRLVAVSNAAATAAISDGTPASRVVVIPNGVDTSRFYPAANMRRSHAHLVTIGNLHPIKGHRDLIEAVRIARADMPHISLSIVGDGPCRQSLQSLVQELGLAKCVTFYGYQREVLAFLQCAQAFVLPSHNEGMSNALLEAMAVGLPVIATAVGGNVEVIEPELNGLLVPPADPQIMAQGLLRVLKDEQLAHRLGLAAAERVRSSFSVETMIARYVRLYREPMAV